MPVLIYGKSLKGKVETKAVKALRSSRNQGVRWSKKSISAFSSIKYFETKIPEPSFYGNTFKPILPIARAEKMVRVQPETIRFLM